MSMFFALAGDTYNQFGINANSGVLFTKSALNYDLNNNYEFVVRTVYQGTPPRATTVTMTISLIDVSVNGTAVMARKLSLFSSIMFANFM